MSKLESKQRLYLAGPITLTEHYSSKYNKHFYILGDRHYKQSKCPPFAKQITVSDFVEQTINNNKDKIIDIFVELEFISEKLTQRRSRGIGTTYIGDWIDLLKECLGLKKDLCAYRNIRAHYIDIRILLPDFPLIILTDMLIVLDSNINSKELYSSPYIKQFIHDVEYVDKQLKQILASEKSFRRHIDFMFDKLKINKQLENIENLSIARLLKDDFESIWNYLFRQLMYDDIRLILNFYYMKELHKTETIRNRLETYTIKFTHLTSSLMDIYAVARMFRTFKDSPQIKHIMYYVGDAHALYLRSVLNRLQFDQYALLCSEEQCLNITNLKWPLFSSIEKYFVFDTDFKAFANYLLNLVKILIIISNNPKQAQKWKFDLIQYIASGSYQAISLTKFDQLLREKNWVSMINTAKEIGVIPEQIEIPPIPSLFTLDKIYKVISVKEPSEMIEYINKLKESLSKCDAKKESLIIIFKAMNITHVLKTPTSKNPVIISSLKVSELCNLLYELFSGSMWMLS